jgi:coenzyme Q-binding protein COQ10
MTTHCEHRILPYSLESIFNLVADVESYPDFLPFWHQARISRRLGNTYYTEQEIGIGPVRERFQSKTVLHPFTEIQVTSCQGIFHRLQVHWTFSPLPDGSCCVSCSLEGQVRSALLRHLFETVFLDSIHSVVAAFEMRASQQYRRPALVNAGGQQRTKAADCWFCVHCKAKSCSV